MVVCGRLLSALIVVFSTDSFELPLWLCDACKVSMMVLIGILRLIDGALLRVYMHL